METLPYVEVEFVLTSAKMVLQNVTNRLDIIPSSIKEIDEWPKLEGYCISKFNSIPTKEWCLRECKEFCNQIETPIKKIIMMLEGKEKELLDLKEEYELKLSLIVIVHSKTMEIPEIVLSNEIIAFFSKIGVEISFDFYLY